MNALTQKLLISALAAALLAATGCGSGLESSSLATDPGGQAVEVVVAQPGPPAVLRSMMACTGEASGAVQHYQVYEWSDGSVFATCEVSDALRQGAGTHLYAADDPSTAAAWALCLVEMPAALEGDVPVVWRFASHRELNAAGVTPGSVEPGFGLRCQQVPVAGGK